MKHVFKSEQAVTRMTEWYERWRARIGVPTESRSVPTQFGDTHVLVGGPPSAPSLVMVHGAMASSAHVMVELAPLLERYRVYAVDVIGQSVKTPHQRPSVANNDYGAWLREVLDGLGLAHTRIVAVSWGGFAAVRLAVIAPERIEKLALLVPAGVVNGHAWQGMTKLVWPLMKYRMFGGDRRFAAFAANLLTTPDENWEHYLRAAFDSFNMDMRVPKLARVEELAAFKAPTFVVAAADDYSIPGAKLVARANILFPALAGTELVADCKHCPPTTDEFRRWLADKLDAFLAGGAAASAAS